MPRKKPSLKNFLPFFFLVFLLVLLAFAFYQLDFFKVKRVICLEEGFPCRPERLEAFEVFYDKNIFFLKTSTLSEKVKKETPEILKLEVHKQLPDTLKITLQKRLPWVYLTVDGKKFFVSDAEGVVLEGPLEEKGGFGSLPLISLPPGLLELKVGLELVNYEALQKALLLQELLKEFFIDFEELKVEEGGDLSLFLSEGVTATFSTKKELKPQVASLQLILKQSKMEEPFLQNEKGKIIKEIDLRFEKPVIKFQ